MSGSRVPAVLVAVLGTAGVLGLGALSLVMEALTFDSPRRTTSSDLVFGLLVGGVGGLLLAVWLLAAAQAARGRPAARPLVVLAAFAGVVGGTAYAVSMGLAFSFK